MISGSQPPWLAEAWREYGQREIAGERHNKRILSFFRELGHDPAGGDEVAWCAAFAGASLERAGVASTRSLRARSYSEWGEALAAERFGAVVVLSRGRSAALGHVGFLVGWTAERLWLLGGNQADRVSVEAFDRSRLVALRWPRRQSNQRPPATGEGADDLFAAALAHVLRMEGGYSDDPHDLGGPTNMGITLATLAAWRGMKVSAANRQELIAQLRQISRAETEAIYRQRYWIPAGCPDLPAALAFAHFDAAVNHGVGAAIRMLQEAVGAGVDGIIGPQTKSRIAAMPIAQIIRTYAAIRRRRYRALPHFWRFGRGWLNRVEHTLEAVEKLPREISGPLRDTESTSERNGETRMSSKDISDTGPKWWGQSLTIWGVLIAASASVLPALSPIIGLELTADLVRQLGDEVLQVAQAVTALGGTLMAIYGRTKAKQPLIRKSMHLKL